jgi:hypothetical protein
VAVSIAVSQKPIQGIVRMSHVYTPPENRRRGYAAAAFTEFRSTAQRQAIAGFCTQIWEIQPRTRFIAGSGIEQSPRQSTTASTDFRGRVAGSGRLVGNPHLTPLSSNRTSIRTFVAKAE